MQQISKAKKESYKNILPLIGHVVILNDDIFLYDEMRWLRAGNFALILNVELYNTASFVKINARASNADPSEFDNNGSILAQIFIPALNKILWCWSIHHIDYKHTFKSIDWEQ